MAGQLSSDHSPSPHVNSPMPRFESLLEPLSSSEIVADQHPIVAEADTTTQDLVQSLGREDLSVEDLQELRQGFPDTKLEKPDAACSSGYPESVPVFGLSSFGSISIPLRNHGLQSFDQQGHFSPRVSTSLGVEHTLNQAQGEFIIPCGGQQESQGRTGFHLLYCDVRNNKFGLHRMISGKFSMDASGSFKTSAAMVFSCSKESVHELSLSRGLGKVQALIIGARETDTHCIVQYDTEPNFACLVLRSESTFREVFQMCYKWLEELQKASPQSAAKNVSHSLLTDKQRFDESSVHVSACLKNFELVYFVRAEPVTIKVIHCVDVHSEQTYYIDCLDTWTVQEVKQQFVQLYQPQHHVNVDLSAVWFTLAEKVISNDQILKWHAGQFALDDADTVDLDWTLSTTFYVHFQPPDSVLVRLHFKSDLKRNMHLKSERLIVVSPFTTTDSLRWEIAKIIHKDPVSFKMFISGKKIEADTDLETLLRSQNCTVVVEQRSKIRLTVDTGVAGSETPQRVTFQMHKYESVAKLKQEVCNKLQVPFYAVDLKHGNTPLQEQHNLRTSRLRDSDTVQAVVLPNRMRVKVRLFSGHWEDIVVDDLTVSTVRQLKLFTESLVKQRCASTSGNRYGEHAERGPVSTSASQVEFSVIFNGRVLSDEDTLREAGVMMNGKLVLVQAEKNCFTAVCGLVPIFLSHASGMLRREIVMSDGKMFYFGAHFFSEAAVEGSSSGSTDHPIIFPRQSDHTVSTGLHVCPRTLKLQFPPDVSIPNPPDTREQSHYVCTVCKSNSVPSFSSSSADNVDSGIVRSRSDTLNQSTSPSVTFETFQREAAEKVTSTPAKGGVPVSKDCVDGMEPVCSTNHADVTGSASTSSFCAGGQGQVSQQTSFSTHGLPPDTHNTSAHGLPPDTHNTSAHGLPPDTHNTSAGSVHAFSSTGNIPSFQFRVPDLPRSKPEKDCRECQETETSVNPAAHNPEATSPQANNPVKRWVWSPMNSCPDANHLHPCRPSIQHSVSSGYASENEAIGRRKAATRSVFYQESVEKDKDGRLIVEKNVHTRQQVDPDMIKYFKSTDAPQLNAGSQFAALPASADPHVQHLEDTTFAYIDRNIIMHVAQQLGNEAVQLILHLGVPHRVYDEAVALNPGKLFQIHYHCLRVWCQMKRAEGTTKELIEALKSVERFDLVESVEDYEQKTMSGYQTV